MNEERTFVVADDSESMRNLLARILSGPSVRIVAAKDGREALEAGLALLPDLIILDQAMPRLGGVGAVKALREDERTRDIPVLLITGGADEEGGGRAADDWLAKPFELTEFLARVDRLVALGRRRRAAAV